MSRVATQLKDLSVGDLVYADIIIDKVDVADPKSKSSTATKIKQGKPVRRICVVLVPGQTSVQVTYVATFDQSTTLPSALDKTMWYPFKPATKEGSLSPLPELSNGLFHMTQLGSTAKELTKNLKVDKISGLTIPATSAQLILGQMKA